MPAQQFRKKPVAVQAIQWIGEENCAEVFAFLGLNHDEWEDELDHSVIHVETLEGTLEAHHGDWIVKGTRGEHWPVRADIFAETYEPVEAAS